jgi:hypothetical protein
VVQTIEFSRGDATLIVGPVGLVFCDGFSPSSKVSDEIRVQLETGISAKRLFVRLIALHAGIDGAQIIACVDDNDRAAVLNLSPLVCTVITEASEGFEQLTTLIDPSDRSFVMERVIAGRLVQCDVHSVDPRNSKAHLPFCSSGGVLPVGDCSVRFGQAVSSSVELRLEPEEVVIESHETLHETLHEFDDTDDIYDDEEDDALTVWPSKGLSVHVDSPDPSRPTSEILVPDLRQIPPAEAIDRLKKSEPPEMPIEDNEWRPPTWEPGESLSNVSNSLAALSPTAPLVAPARLAEPKVAWVGLGKTVDESNEDDLTLMESGEVTSTSRVAFTPQMVTSEEVVGTFCTNNHFTDSRRLRCLFCDAETQFDHVDVGSRPLLGRLRFDTGEVVELQHNVLIGRKPTPPDGVAVHIVAIDDDRLLSRLHVEVRIVDWDIVVVDRQSANGTSIVYPDGRRMATRANVDAPLERGSIVHFGKHHFVFEGPTVQAAAQ